MTFFIPERTTCRICGRLIVNRIDAAQLEWVHPDDAGDLAQLSRSFVHRDCWQPWEYRDTFTAAARALRLAADDDAPLVEYDGVFVYERGTGLSIEDVVAPITLSISASEKPLVLEWLVTILSEGPAAADSRANRLLMEEHSLSASWHGEELDITLAYEGKDTQQFTLSAARRDAWWNVLQSGVIRTASKTLRT